MQNSAEVELLLSCLSINPDSATKKKIKKLSSEKIDWDWLFNFSKQHKVSPFLNKNLRHVNPPVEFVKNLKGYCLSIAVRNLHISDVLLKIIFLFKDENIDCLPFKGPVLSDSLYGDTSMRVYSDLDILVSVKDAMKARELLIQNGYTPEVDLNEKQAEIYLNNEFDFKLIGEEGQIVVELHWDIAAKYLYSPVNLEMPDNDLSTYKFNKKLIKTLSNEFLLVYLCVHGCKHQWHSIEQVLSISELIKNSIDWERVLKKANELRCQRMVFIGLLLSKKCFDAAVPADILKKILNDRVAVRLYEMIYRDFFYIRGSDDKKNESRFSFFHFRVRERFPDKIRYGFYLLFNPSRKEWMKFPLPASFSFIHIMIRPIRLLVLFLRRY